MSFEQGRVQETVTVEDGYRASDGLKWKCVTDIEDRYVAPFGEHRPGDVVRNTYIGNVLVNGGADVIWERLITLKPSTSSTGTVTGAFTTGTSRIGVGTSTATAAASQTDLSATAPNKAYDGMESGYPSHTTGTSTDARSCTFRSLFSTAQANFAWNEFAVFNSTVAARRMLQRKVQSMGTKSSAATRQITVTLTLS
jgi:hypothetical protein